jgi:plasmid stability protein
LKVRFQTNLDEEILKKLKVTAAEKGTTVNKLIEDLVRKYLK